jgi:hypothetical protein
MLTFENNVQLFKSKDNALKEGMKKRNKKEN